VCKVLTVVVPSYNIEKYLEKCLDSFIIPEIMEEIEIIIVNDGSKDKTAMIGKEYEDRYPKTFKLISKENGGHGSTINVGIKVASGKYFKVVDGDDWVEKEAFLNLVKVLRTSTQDLVVNNCCTFNNITAEVNKVTVDKQIEYNKTYNLDDIIAEHNFSITMPLYNIKTSILKLNNIIIDENCYYADTEFILYPIIYVNDLIFIDEYVYMYRINQASQSISMNGYYKNRKDRKQIIISLLNYLNNLKELKISPYKFKYVKDIVKEFAKFQYGIYLYSYLPSNCKELKREIKEFDGLVKDICKDIYEETNNIITIKILRTFHFSLLGIFSKIARLRNKIRGIKNIRGSV